MTLPNLFFFIAFFIAFSLLELILIFVLNRWAAAHAQFVIDRLIRFQIHHRMLLRWTAYGSLLLVLGAIGITTPLFSIVWGSTRDLQGFYGGLLAVMILIYFLMTRKATRLALEKRVHQYLYVLLSLFFYTVIALVADDLYLSYQEFIQTQVIKPAVREVTQVLDDQKKEALLAEFRQKVKAGECPEKDFKTEGGSTATAGPAARLKHFVFVTLDTDLIAPDYKDGTDLTQDFSGKVCTDDENTFLLKKDGSWYWVISENL